MKSQAITSLTSEMGSKKHKKHKSEKKDKYDDRQFSLERPPGLKLILKVGGNSSTPEHSNDSPGPIGFASQVGENEALLAELADRHKKAKKKKKKRDREKKHKHHHKEKRRRRDDSSQEDVSMGEESLLEPPIVMQHVQDTHSDVNDSIGDSGREPRSCVLRQRQERSPLGLLLEHLLRALEKRDQHQFFAWPVTDNIAPGYSAIIAKPMDFSTMKQKIDDNQYNSLLEFIDDFKTMCENALRYNHPETIYFKAAKKLFHVGSRLLQPDKLRALRPLLVFMQDIPARELGFELSKNEPNYNTDPSDITAVESGLEEECASQASTEPEIDEAERKKILRIENWPKSKYEAFTDDMTADEILLQAQGAAKNAREKIMAKTNASNMGFLRQRKDGSTSIQILLDCGDANADLERPISLGAFTGKLQQGTGQLQSFREDRRNMAKMVKPLEYGPYCSFAPIYDSRFSNLTKDESELVLHTYGDEIGVQYSDSILEFTKDSSYASILAGNLLDLLTNGDHRKTIAKIQEGQRQRAEEREISDLLPNQVENDLLDIKVDLESLKTLSEFGVDTSFLTVIERELQLEEQKLELQNKLDTNAQMLEKLQKVQNDRLSLPLPQHLSQLTQPSQTELELATQITSNLTEMTKEIAPGEVAPIPVVRKAMGINLPVPMDSAPPLSLLPRQGKQTETPMETDVRKVASVSPTIRVTQSAPITSTPRQMHNNTQTSTNKPRSQTPTRVPNVIQSINNHIRAQPRTPVPIIPPQTLRHMNPNMLAQSQIRSQILSGQRANQAAAIQSDAQQNVNRPRQQVPSAVKSQSSGITAQLRQIRPNQAHLSQIRQQMVLKQQQNQTQSGTQIGRVGPLNNTPGVQQTSNVGQRIVKINSLTAGPIPQPSTPNSQKTAGGLPISKALNTSGANASPAASKVQIIKPFMQQNSGIQSIQQKSAVNVQHVLPQNNAVKQIMPQNIANISPVQIQVQQSTAVGNSQNIQSNTNIAKVIGNSQLTQLPAIVTIDNAGGVDIENELRQFLERGSTALPGENDPTIEQMLME